MIKRIVIAGGGTAGWMTAAALSKKLAGVIEIILVESDELGTVGVGEATIPTLRSFHHILGIDEQEFMSATSATFKLGIGFENWGEKNQDYIHSFGTTGTSGWICQFVHFWLRGLERGINSPFGDYCFELQAAKANKFATGKNAEINYAYHLDATLYAKFLRKYSEALGLKRIEGKIQSVQQNNSTGFIESLTLESGKVIEGDLFIDCTGFRALLSEKTLRSGFDDWGHWLFCDSAIAVQTESVGPAIPYTRSIALDSGWRWRIPLQHRAGNGHVFSSSHISDDEAISQLLNQIEGKPLTEPRVIKYRPGVRRKLWNKNCIAVGLAAGFIEPLESTGIHLFMIGVTKLIQGFPFGGMHQSIADEYNQQMMAEFYNIRDFIIAHYFVTSREDTEFWRLCKNMEIPDTLKHRIDLFKEYGHVFNKGSELFRVDSWMQVLIGQGILPKRYHQIASTMSDAELNNFLHGITSKIETVVSKMPAHQDFVNKYCPVANM